MLLARHQQQVGAVQWKGVLTEVTVRLYTSFGKHILFRYGCFAMNLGTFPCLSIVTCS